MFIAQINKLITENKVNNLSIILNGVEMSRLKYGYGYGYSYGYGSVMAIVMVMAIMKTTMNLKIFLKK